MQNYLYQSISTRDMQQEKTLRDMTEQEISEKLASLGLSNYFAQSDKRRGKQ